MLVQESLKNHEYGGISQLFMITKSPSHSRGGSLWNPLYDCGKNKFYDSNEKIRIFYSFQQILVIY